MEEVWRELQRTSESGTVKDTVGPEGGEGSERTAVPHPAERSSKTWEKLSFHIPEPQTSTCKIRPEAAPVSFSNVSPSTSFCFGQIELFCLLCASLIFRLLLLFLSWNECFRDHVKCHDLQLGLNCFDFSLLPAITALCTSLCHQSPFTYYYNYSCSCPLFAQVQNTQTIFAEYLGIHPLGHTTDNVIIFPSWVKES